MVQAEEAAKFLKQRLGGASLDDAMAHSANSLGRIEFGEALESSALRVIVTAGGDTDSNVDPCKVGKAEGGGEAAACRRE